MISSEMRDSVSSCAERHGAHLVDLKIRSGKGRTIVEVFVDAEQGVTSELCAAVSREIGETIEKSEWLQGSYRLDVSSPGIERPLLFPWQWKKHVGRALSITLQGPEGVAIKKGTLVSADDTTFVLKSGEGHPPETIAFAAVTEAFVESPW